MHSEGLAEQLGEIVLLCSGSPGVTVKGNLNVMLNIPITNRINSNGYATDATLSINTDTTPVPSGIQGRVTNQSISFNGFQFTFPASGTVSLLIDDIRGDANSMGLQPQRMPITAAFSGTLPLYNAPAVVAYAQQGLLANTQESAVTCSGSPTPASPNLTNLFSTGTAVQTTRVTEGFPTSFQPKDIYSDTGTRFLLSYSGFPAGSSIYLPDAVAGGGATVPTSGGDMGMAPAVGQYTPGSQTLLLVRVVGADSTGTGGTLTPLPAPNGSGVLVLDGASAVTLTNGAGYAVYEVVASNPSAIESAQIPNFFGIAQGTAPTVTSGGLSLAPVSNVTTASTTAPIPRFVAVVPPSDCSTVGDCNASFYPQLKVTANQTLQATVVAGSTKRVNAGDLTIDDGRGGVLDWAIGVTYTTGSGWVVLSQQFGVDHSIVAVEIDPSKLTPGVYQATVTVDGGSVAGSQSFPVTVTVNPATQPATVTVTSVTNAADFHPGPVVPGEFASIWGTNLAGKSVSVALNGTQANLLYTGAQQINLRIPATLAGQTSAQLVVTADGASSAPFTVALASVSPAIFTPGVLNQDYSVNSASQPAALGSVLQIFGTGMPDSGGTVTVTLQGRGNLVPMYAGAAPGLPGMQQVDVMVPSDLQPVASNLIVCVSGSDKQQYCSQPESIALK